LSRAYGTNNTERGILIDAGAKPHKNSGRGMKKGDGSDNTFVWDVKEALKSFSVSQANWDKICSDAYKVDPYKNPGLLVVLGGTQKLAVIEISVLKEIMAERDELRSQIETLLEDAHLLSEDCQKIIREKRKNDDS